MSADTKALILEGMRVAWIMVFLAGLLTDFYDFIVGVAIAVAIASAKFILARMWRVPMTEAQSGHGAVMRTQWEAWPFGNRSKRRR